MVWYGGGRLLAYKKKLISIKDLLAPLYLASVPLLALASLAACYYWILLLPYLASFPFSMIKTFNEGFKEPRLLLMSLLFPFIMVFKSFGIIIGIVKSIIR